MATHPPLCVVFSFDDEEPQLYMCTVQKDKILPLFANRMIVPVFEGVPDIDDEMLRKMALTAMNLLALGQPSIKQYMSATPFDDDPPQR
jgi:hypothetical protein